MASLLSAAVLVTAVQAMALDKYIPVPTDAGAPTRVLHMPEITVPPSVQELAKRQEEESTVYLAPDSVCGYFDGRLGAPFNCARSYTCALFPLSSWGFVGCCNDYDCNAQTACLDYRDIVSSSLCDINCFQDTMTAKCTNTQSPYCNTATFFDGIVDYYCDSLDYSTPQQIYTTFDGQSRSGTFSTVTLTSDETEFTEFTDFTSATTTRPNHSSATDSNGDEDGDSTSTADGALSTANSGVDQPVAKSSSTPIGAIVGGVVGGVAALALLGVGIFFLVRHNKKKKTAALAATTQPPVSQAPQGPGAGAAAGYAPHNSQYGQQQYPPQQQQGYYDPSKPGGFTSVAPTIVPDRNNSTSPVSPYTDGRQSYQPTSPTSTVNSNWQQQNQAGVPYTPQQQQQQANVPPTVHEASGNAVGERDYNGNHHGQLHEMG